MRAQLEGFSMFPSIFRRNAILLTVWMAAHVLPGSAQSFQWIRQFGSPTGDFAYGVAASPSGIYVVGSVSGTLPGETSTGSTDAFVRKYDQDGNILWTRQFGTAAFDHATGVAADSSGVYVVGDTQGTLPGQVSAGVQDVFIRKYDSSGTVVWTRQLGTAGNDAGYGAAIEPSGVYVAGTAAGALPGQTFSGEFDAFVRKYDLTGAEQWTRQFGTSGTDLARDVAADVEGVYVAGIVRGSLPGQSSAGGADAFVRKYNPGGSEEWTRQFGSASDDNALGTAVSGSGVYVAGATSGALAGGSSSGFSDAFLKKYDTSGADQWTRQFGSVSPDSALGAAADPTGAYVVGFAGAAIGGETQVGGQDAFVRKYDVNGNDRWTHQFGTNTLDTAAGADADSSGFYLTGYTQGTMPGGGAGGQDAFLSKLHPGGPPYLPFNAVVGGASFVPSVTAGSIASAFGYSLLPQNPGGLLVQANAQASPVYAATHSQINFQVPWELAASQQNFLVVTVDGSAASPVSIPVANFAPGIFSTDASGSGQGAILIANTAFVAAPNGAFPGSRPVNRGESISIFATGLGAVNNRPPTGVAAGGNSTTIAQPTVTIGGMNAPVSFSGLAPGFFGLYQVNVQVPQNAPVGGAVQVVLTIGGVSSNAVTIAVQ
jgi:uncharacterized protein (TIGR03437 family)